MLDKMLSFNGNYISKLQNYFKAMNKPLWSGSAKNGATLDLPELYNYDVISVQFELQGTTIVLNRYPNSGVFRGSATATYEGNNCWQYINLQDKTGNNKFVLETYYNQLTTSGYKVNNVNYGITSIVGVVPTPKKFGLGGYCVVSLIRYLLQERRWCYAR